MVCDFYILNKIFQQTYHNNIMWENLCSKSYWCCLVPASFLYQVCVHVQFCWPWLMSNNYFWGFLNDENHRQMFTILIDIKKETLLFYYLCCCCLCISSFREFPVLQFSRPIPDFYAEIPDLYTKIPCYLGFYLQYHARCTTGGMWGPLGGLEASLASYVFLVGLAV